MQPIFDGTPEGFHGKPIERPVLESTGLPEGDDSGYRKVPVDESGEPIVDLRENCRDVALRASYDGFDEVDGIFDEGLVLPGGTDDRVYARRSVAVAIDTADAYFADRYSDHMKLGILDAFRSGKRQAAGFTRKVIEVLAGNITPDTKTLYQAGMTADGTFSWVNPDFDSAQYCEFLAAMTADASKFADLQAIALESGIDIDEVVANFVTICANIQSVKRFFLKAPTTPLNIDIPLNFQNNAHAGGGAIDTFLLVDRKPASSPVPFDWVGEEAAIEFTESDENLDRFKARVQSEPVLQTYLRKLGIDPDNITQQNWEFWRACNRILHHTMKAVGATYYSAADPRHGGENWHKEPGNLVYHPPTGRVVHDGGFADRFPNSGNPGHALQRMPKGKATAVWGGKGAHEQLGL